MRDVHLRSYLALFSLVTEKKLLYSCVGIRCRVSIFILVKVFFPFFLFLIFTFNVALILSQTAYSQVKCVCRRT